MYAFSSEGVGIPILLRFPDLHGVLLVEVLYRSSSKEKSEEREGHSSLHAVERRFSILQLCASKVALVLDDAAVLDDSGVLHNPLRLHLALQEILVVQAIRLRLAVE